MFLSEVGCAIICVEKHLDKVSKVLLHQVLITFPEKLVWIEICYLSYSQWRSSRGDGGKYPTML